ncbi:biopolymer transporter ExbD [Flavobacterium cyanobacteriorum]|uniref:Biopolymer transporter ExbD n=1 Tax=Flavobacterium cyanobacteriorum TaxID=2022802 RepID=A0A255ZDM9_9FLAO|nr:biopolymer transporter ExbD [Flavobacterium cyanobacteriorum]OYQ39542.1 biopolymer transporter ExbD [Flavobacterium cyanobacteriorum]
MAKVKVSKKSTRIDMTAMCDVAFLLLSFFIMTATAKQPEPKVVDTPASTVLDKLPEEGVATITIGDKSVFFTIPGKELRRETLKRISGIYKVPFTEQEYETFSNMEGFGVPLNQLKGLLKLGVNERNAEGLQKGIPYDSVNNQLRDWIKEAREANKTLLNERIQSGELEPTAFKDLDIAIKGDAKEEYPTVKRVIDILQDQKKNRFFLVTGLRNENF